MKRRQALRRAVVAGTLMSAGCIGGGTNEPENGEPDETTHPGPVNHGLPRCEDSNTPIRISNTNLSVTGEEAVVSLVFEFISGRGGSETPPPTISVTFQVEFINSQGDEVGQIADSVYTGTDEPKERSFTYAGPDFEQTVAFRVNVDPKACA